MLSVWAGLADRQQWFQAVAGLVELDAYDAKLEDLNVEAVLNYATDALRNAGRFWIQCSADQKQNFQRVLFPEGLVFEGESYRTAPTCIAFRVTCRNFRG
jgi:hypothetical protein